jgi:hypothetical protein
MKTDKTAPSVETDDKSICIQREGSLNAAEMESTHPTPSQEGSACVTACVPEKTATKDQILVSTLGFKNRAGNPFR